jgi:Zn-finger nucleic acid-binding protein
MGVYAMGDGGAAIEFDYCPICHGVFLDKGEGAALDALDSRDAAGTLEIQGATGARFAAPSAELDRQSIAIERTREAGGRSFFADFVADCFKVAAMGTQVALDPALRQHRRRRFFSR